MLLEASRGIFDSGRALDSGRARRAEKNKENKGRGRVAEGKQERKRARKQRKRGREGSRAKRLIERELRERSRGRVAK